MHPDFCIALFWRRLIISPGADMLRSSSSALSDAGLGQFLIVLQNNINALHVSSYIFCLLTMTSYFLLPVYP